MSSIPTTSNQLTPHVDKIYMLGYINKAERQSPHAFDTLKTVAIAVTAVAVAALLSYPAALLAVAQTTLTFTASYAIGLPVISLAVAILLEQLNHTHHWFDVRAAALILEPKEKILNWSFFSEFYPYHYKHQEAPAAEKKPDAAAAPKPDVEAPSVHTPIPKSTLTQLGIVMGCNYEGVKEGKYKLKNCQNDARHIKELLLKAGFAESDIKLMLDLPQDQGKDSFPSKKNFLTQLESLVNRLSEAAKAKIAAIGYVHDSGHGLREPERVKGTEPGGMSDEMVAGDFEFIRDEDLHALIKKNLHPDAVLRVTFDCCHSGTMLDLKYNYKFKDLTGGKTTVLEEIDPANTDKEDDFGHVVMISGCLDDQTSADGVQYGAMTAAYYATLEEHNYNLTWRQLLIGINQKLKATGLSQNPQLSSSRKLNLDHYALTSEVRFNLHSV